MAISIEVGNVYHDGMSTRLIGLTPNPKTIHTFRWYYRVHGTESWKFFSDSLTTLPIGSLAITTKWFNSRPHLKPNTHYDILCSLNFSNGAEHKTYTTNVWTNDYAFEIVKIGTIPTKFRFDPKRSIVNGTKLYFFRAPDAKVRSTLLADAWVYMGGRTWNSAKSDTAQFIFTTEEAYTKYDFKIIFVNSSNHIIDIVFMED